MSTTPTPNRPYFAQQGRSPWSLVRTDHWRCFTCERRWLSARLQPLVDHSRRQTSPSIASPVVETVPPPEKVKDDQEQGRPARLLTPASTGARCRDRRPAPAGAVRACDTDGTGSSSRRRLPRLLLRRWADSSDSGQAPEQAVVQRRFLVGQSVEPRQQGLHRSPARRTDAGVVRHGCGHRPARQRKGRRPVGGRLPVHGRRRTEQHLDGRQRPGEQVQLRERPVRPGDRLPRDHRLRRLRVHSDGPRHDRRAVGDVHPWRKGLRHAQRGRPRQLGDAVRPAGPGCG